ncbi:MAG: hypothetical protein PHF56_10745 [Desulfuromonadaceae bacterium]|nr:hypothetical protein [Desulfuromonadaceae bacterium]
MSRIITFLLVFLIGTMLSTPISAASKRPADVWNYYHFDGTAFAPGPADAGTAFVAVREKVQPVVLTTEAVVPESVELPDDSGVIAGICYFQSSGGKLGSGRSFNPCPRIPLLIFSAGKQLVTVQTDDHGYFVVVLPAGVYSVSNGPFAAEINVERGITTLVPLRAGKRMVD